MNSEHEVTSIAPPPAGLPVIHCVPGSVAYNFGVRGGDIIVEVNGAKITDAVSYLRACRLSRADMLLKVRRGSSLLELAIPLDRQVSQVNVTETFRC